MQRKATPHLLLTALLWACTLLAGRAQTLDPTFQPTVLRAAAAPGLQTATQLQTVQPDGKILIAGGFDFVNGTVGGKVYRLNADGTNDTSFNPGGPGANGFISSLLLQPDGKILIGGGFTAYNGTARLTVARLNANGTLDATFLPTGITVRRQIGVMALQPDGKILVGGSSNLDTGIADGGVLRLNPDGSLDTSFNVGTGASSGGAFVRALFVQADGKILVGGTFTTFNGQTVGNLVRVNSNGSFDATFALGTGFDGAVRAIAQQPDGKLVIGGAFTLLNGQAAPRLVRVLLNGALDPSLIVGTGPNGTVLSLLIQSNGGAQFNGSVVFAGSFTFYNGQVRNRVARVFDNGTLDATFGTSATANNTVTFVSQIGTGQFLVSGNFTQYDGLSATGLARVTATGAADPVFTTTTQVRGTIGQAAPLSNGQLLVAGNFSVFNGTAITGTSIRRVNADGTLDPAYSTAASGSLYGAQPDGTFYALSTSGTQFRLQRVLPSGAIDNAFTGLLFGSTSAGGLAALQGVTVQADGRLLVYGNFTTFGSANRNGIVRLNADGTLDNSFTPPASTLAHAITQVAIQPSGKIAIVYQEVGTGAALGSTLTRLNADGTQDNTFAGVSAAGLSVSILPQPDGKLLLSGNFTSFGGQPAPFGIVRLGLDGALDPSFNGVSGSYSLRLVQPDGRILATAGAGGTLGLVRLNTNGSLDNTFTPVAIPNAIFTGDDFLANVVLQPADGKIIAYGSFRTVLGQPRFGLARLINPGVTATQPATARLPLTVYPNPARTQLTVGIPAGQTQPVRATLLSVQGQVVRTWLLPSTPAQATLDVHTLAPGLYILQLPTAQGTYQQKVLLTE